MEFIEPLKDLKEKESSWEPILRHDFISSKRRELEELSDHMIKYRFTQWDTQSLFIGAFLGHCIMSTFSAACLPLIISIYFLLSFFHLRVRRDVYTLYSNLISHTIYTLILSFYIFFSRRYGASMHILVMLTYSSLSHTYAWIILDKCFGLLDSFSGYSFEFVIPTLKEVHGALVGATTFLGIIFLIVRLYPLTYASLISVVFALLTRWKYKSIIKKGFQSVSREPQVLSPEEETFPNVQSLLSLVFTLISLVISIVSCFDENKLYIGHQHRFLSYIADNKLGVLHIRKVTAMCSILALNLFLLFTIQFLFLIQFVFKYSSLDKLLHCKFRILGRACTDAMHNKIFRCDLYCLDAGNRVKGVETFYKKYYKGKSSRFDKNLLCIENLYLVVQEYILKTEKIKSLYCFLLQKEPVDPLKKMDPLVNCRIKLERWNRELSAMIEAERKRREEKRQALIKRLEEEILPSVKIDGFRGAPKRSISIPIELSLGSFDPDHSSKPTSNRRCLTSAVTNESHLETFAVDELLKFGREKFVKWVPECENNETDEMSSMSSWNENDASEEVTNENILVDCGDSDAELDTLIEYFLARQYTSDKAVDDGSPDTSLSTCEHAESASVDRLFPQETPSAGTNAESIEERLKKAEYGKKKKKLKFSGKRSVKNLTKFFNKAFKSDSTTPCSQIEYTSQDCTPVSVTNVHDNFLDQSNAQNAFIDGAVDEKVPVATPQIYIETETEITQTNLPTYISVSEAEETPKGSEFPLVDDPLTLVRTYEMSEFSRKAQQAKASNAPMMVIPISHMHKNFYDSSWKVAQVVTGGQNFCSSGGETGRVEPISNDLESQFTTDSESPGADQYAFINDELEAYTGHRSLDVTPTVSRTESIMRDLIDDISVQDSDELESNASFNYILGK